MKQDVALKEAFSSSCANALPLDEAPFVDISNGIKGRYGLCPVANISRNPANVRTHSKKQIRKIARSFDVSGPVNPVIVDEKLVLLAGEARVAARRQQGEASIPVVQIFGLSEAQKRAYLIADNRIALDAGWDYGALASQLPDLTVLLGESGFTIEDTGFEIAEIDEIIADFGNGADPSDDIPASILSAAPVCQDGDLVQLGEHRLLVGDARDVAALDRLAEGAQVNAAFLDVPYNVRVRDIVGRGRIKHDEFAHASGEMSRSEFKNFLTAGLENATRLSLEGSVHFVCIDRKHIRDLIEVAETAYDAVLDVVIWNKTNAGQGGLYRQQYEMIVVGRVGAAPHRNNVQLGKFGRNRSNVWTYPGGNTFRAGRMEDLEAHPTVKPLRLVADALLDVTRPGDFVLDTFAGSGTTILAAEKTGRRALAMEISPKFADVAVRRWQAATGRDAVHVETGLTFDELAVSRRAAT